MKSLVCSIVGFVLGALGCWLLIGGTGHYVVTVAGALPMRYNATTGQTWLLGGGPEWKLVAEPGQAPVPPSPGKLPDFGNDKP